jgi:hypothetical protein
VNLSDLDEILDGAKLTEEQMGEFRATAYATTAAILSLPFAPNKEEVEELISFNNLTMASLLAISATQAQGRLEALALKLVKASLVALL